MPWDASELDQLGTDLGVAATKLAVGVRGVLAKGAVNIKAQLRAEMGSSQHFGQVASSIRYDEVGRGDAIEFEIGPTKQGAGPLANIAYFGTSRGGGTVPDPLGALTAEAATTVDYLNRLLDQAI